MSAALRLALIGATQASAHHVRVIAESSRAKLDVVIDEDLERAQILAEKAGCIMASDIAAAEGCQAAIVATPPETHAEIAIQLINAGIPVLVETPLATDIADAVRVKDAAANQGVPLACGFVERFNPVVKTARSYLDEAPTHIVAIRHTPRNHRATANVIGDLMIHDIDLAMQFGGGALVDTVKANTWTPPGERLIELADATIAFPSGLIATLSASRLGHREIRNFMLVTTNKLIELDLLRQYATITRHISHEWLLEGGLPAHREQIVVDSPMVRHTGEPLALQLEHFLDLAEGRLDMAAVRNGLMPPHQQAYKVEQS